MDQLGKIEIEETNGNHYNEKPVNGFTITGRQSAISSEIMRRFRIQNQKLMEQVALLKERLRYTDDNSDIKLLEAFNKELSDALGSCPKCWGENPDCANCNGQGSPGWRDTNKKDYKNKIEPLLKKIFSKKSLE